MNLWRHHFLAIIFSITNNQGGAGRFTCDAILYLPLCPETKVQCTCVVSGTFSTTRWIFGGLKGEELCPHNFIELLQPSPCAPPVVGSSDSCGAYLMATNKDPGVGHACDTSTLTISGQPKLNGLQVECQDESQGLLVGNITVIVVAPPGDPMITEVLTSTNDMAVTWIPTTVDGSPTSYNISISDSYVPVNINTSGAMVYTHTFMGLMSDTLYTVLLVAINCAGVSNSTKISMQTLADPPKRDTIMLIRVSNNSASYIYVTWKPVGGSVTTYRVRVTGDGQPLSQGTVNCTVLCLYIQNQSLTFQFCYYTFYLASINANGNIGPENNMTIWVNNSIKIRLNTSPTASAIRSSEDYWLNDHRVIAAFLLITMFAACGGLGIIGVGAMCCYYKRKMKRPTQSHLSHSVILSDVIYDDLIGKKCSLDEQLTTTMNIAYAASSTNATYYSHND